ncbi:MAG: glycosyltransferase family 4 protein [Gammaproteobacteria bacterium]|nr:glycosyltransferase family 4 protein [Gammaproteobacteria bacterium]
MTRQLTVVQILPAMEAGGVERGTVEVGSELVRQGHRAIVISAGGRMVHELTRHKVEHVTWKVGAKSLTTLRFIRKLRKFLRDENVDILHARSRLPAWIAYRAWRGMDPKNRPRFVTTVHGFYSVNRYSAIMTKGERVIAVSESIKKYIQENYPATDPARIQVIPRGVDPKLYPHGHRPSPAWSQTWYQRYPHLLDRLVLTLPGRITRLKGHEDFIELIARLRAQGLAVHGLIVGAEDPRRLKYAEELHRRVRERGLEGDITFTGPRNDMREVYASSNIVLSLSQQPESFGRTVLEALSLGVPVIGYEHGGVGEVLATVFPEGRVAMGNMDELAAKVTSFLARTRSVSEVNPYTLAQMLDKTLELYASLATGRA